MRDNYTIIEENVRQATDLLNSLKEFNDKNILSREILRAAAVCKVYDELAFADFRAKCKAHREVTLTLFNEAVNNYTRKVRREFSRFEDNAKIIQLNPSLENIYVLPPLPNNLNLKIPPAYTCSTRGIVIDKVTPNGKHKTKFVAYSPFFIVERLCNIDDHTEKYKAAIYIENGWRFITAGRHDFSEEHRLAALSKYGLGVDSVIARDTVTYVSELIRYNLGVIPVTKVFSQIGWRRINNSELKMHNSELNYNAESKIGQNTLKLGKEKSQLKFIYPPQGKDYIVDTSENDEIKMIYQTRGDRQIWLAHYDKIKTYRHARLAFDAALAASFIELINMRNMTLCMWGKSGGGKTAGVIKFPMSIHGDPKYVPTFNSTFASLERRVLNSNNMPFAVDELQNITNKFQLENIDKFAHIVGEGVSKGRTAKNGELETLKRFSTIALITGEQPLTGFSSDQGKKRRTVEFYCREVLPRELAEKTHEFVNEHFGLIGREWVEVVRDHINDIKSMYKYFIRDFKKRRPDAIPDHIKFLAAAYAADVIFNVYFRNMTIEDVLWKELYNYRQDQIVRVLFNLPTERETSTAERAKVFIKEIISSRRKHFITDDEKMVQDPIFGYIKNEYVVFYPYKLKEELKKAGFSPDKIIDELIDERFLFQTPEGKLRLTRK